MNQTAREPLRCRVPAVATVQADNERVRVTRWDFPPGAETGWHRHGWAYVVVPVTDGTMTLELPGGQTGSATIRAGIAYDRLAGVEHNVINEGDTPFAFVEIEMKGLPG
ncbi:cupin domain-containing protein [Roseomonas cutis]|uniref:cupin domain-containing protein n=1 Tax=Roseomonas cutis TaxID=2897332 RepID=UPI002729AD2C|nr:cupin domain-containing protein [Roseomonas sp. OT10]